jgi:hypothetical protein
MAISSLTTKPSGKFARIDAFAQREQFLDLRAQMRLQGQQVLIADGFAFGGIGMDLGSIQADVAQLQHTSHLGQQQHLHEQILQLGQERFAKGGQSIVIGVQVAGDEAEWHGLIGRPFQLAGTKDAGGIAIEQQAEQDFGRIRLPTSGTIPRVDGRQVEVGDQVDHKARQVVGWEAVAQPHRHI